MKWIHVIKNAFVTGIMGFIMSGLICYFFIAIPENVIGNAIGNGVSGFMSGFMGILMYFVVGKEKRNRNYE